jgi:hypothetical protein
MVKELFVTSTKTFTTDIMIETFIMLFGHNLDKYFKEKKIENKCRVLYVSKEWHLLYMHEKGAKLMLFYDHSLFKSTA